MVFPLIGALIGGLFNASLWGWAIGAIANVFFSKDTTTTVPGLQNTRVTVSTYGQPIRRTFGSNRAGGNVIWGLDKLELRYRTDKIGGGFLTSSTNIKTPLYRFSWAVAFNANQITKFQKVWLNEKLIFDISPAASASERSNSLEQLNLMINGLRFYYGTETQDPDPYIISVEETSELPAYRGIAYIVFVRRELAEYGNGIPNATAKLIVEGDLDATAWVDISDELTLTTQVGANAINNSRRNHGAAVAFGFLWVAGGALSNNDDTNGSVLKAVQSDDDNDRLDWAQEPLPAVMTAREQFELVSFPNVRALGDNLYALGGWTNLGGGGESYFADLDDGDMIQRLDDHDGTWKSVPVRAAGVIPTNDHKPFPRDSFCAAYFAGGEHGARIWMYGGTSTGGDALSWIGAGDGLQDIWSFDGDEWEIHTAFDDIVTPTATLDGGAGLRVYASMTVFKESLYMGGGELIFGGSRVPRRDVFKFNNAVQSPRFLTSIGGDAVGTTDILDGIDWPLVGAFDTFSYGVYELLEWRGKLVALLHKADITNPTFYFFWSDDAVTWDLISNGRWVILGTSSGTTWRISGDQTDEIKAGDSFLAADTAAIKTGSVSSVSYVPGTDTTEIFTVVLVLGSITSTSFFWIDKFQGLLSTNESGTLGRSMRVTNFNRQMIFTGGEVAPAGTDEIQIARTNPTTITADFRLLSSIVTELSVDVGLTEDEIDVTELTDEVTGYTLNNRESSRSSIERLMRAYFFDAVESGGKMKFPKRGGASIATIATEDLAARAYGTKFPGLVEMTRDQDLELPDRIDITYFSEARNYEESTQIAQRIIGNSFNQTSIDFPLVLTDDQAAQIAEVLLYDSWIERSNISFHVSNEYLYLEPGDIVTLPLNDETIVARITRTDHTRPGILKCRAVQEDVRIYTTQVAGGSDEVSTFEKSLIKDFSGLEFYMDIPIINNGDDDHGFYYATAPSLAEDEVDWPGMELWVKSESSEEYGFAASTTAFIFNGTADTVLPSATPGFWDNGSNLTVTINNGTFSTDTEDNVQAGANLLLVGSELVGFVTATDLGGAWPNQQYTLSKFLRGLFGTEWAIGTHGANERVILLDRSKMERVDLVLRTVGKELTYKRFPIGFGSLDTITTTATFTNFAIGKKPYAPGNLSATRDSNNEWLIKWTRRPRGGIALLGGFGTPLIEEREAYEIDFKLNGSIVHTEEVLVLNMNQDKQRYHVVPEISVERTLIDGELFIRYGQDRIYGETVSQIHIEVFQMSDTVGRGYVAGGVFNA